MKVNQIRQEFINFFKEKEHEIVDSAPIVLKDDPTLMFTNAGMNQFKDVFVGNSPIKFPRIADTQKCLRVSGKHNDLEEVGVDTYHHTMFEMLGNWSFGDYFKEESIKWAWEFLTERLKLDKDILYVTIFEGDKADGLPLDEEAKNIWKNYISEDRILLGDKKDNFWEMGAIGPCGPCSEIHVDIRSEEEKAKVDGKDLVNKDHPQVVEIWNLVFMQFNRMADGSLKPLPNKHIDTGMGLERLAMVMQNVKSNYDTDAFQGLIGELEKMSTKSYKIGSYQGEQEAINIALRVIADHIRAIAFCIADGQLPSNTGAGYVIRRVLRRAVRYGYQTLDLKEPFMHLLLDKLSEQMGQAFPELLAQKELIAKVIKEEESSFFRTLETGLKILDDKMAHSSDKISGKDVFELYDTFGFPVDLTRLIASENNLSIDEAAFEEELNTQKNRSRADGTISLGDWVELLEDDKEEFVGYDNLEIDVRITRYREAESKGKKQYQVVFNLTPFYPEGGGQVGDTGYIESQGKKYAIIDTKKENQLIVHTMKELPENPSDKFKAVVSKQKRTLSAKHHSATHLLHEALREVLGDHVEQKGSLVNSEYLRFDFSHFQKVEKEELEKIEKLVNDRIWQNIPLDERRNTPIDQAKEMGAMALFGEKYGDTVRVIKFGSSVELCGGTHVPATGNIGLFKITSEGAVASGIRRVEALAGERAFEHLNNSLGLVSDLKSKFKTNDLAKSIDSLQQQNAQLQKELEAIKKEQAAAATSNIDEQIKEINGTKFLGLKLDLDGGQAKDLAFKMRQKHPDLFMVIGSENNGKAILTLMVGDDLVASKGLKAGELIRDLAKHIQGGGGGQPFFATAGGKNPEGLDQAIKAAEDILA